MATSNASPNLGTTFSRNLKRARKEAGLTQLQLANALGGQDPMAVSRWERGVSRPVDENLIALCHALGRDAGWFYTDHEGAAA